jgi:imidazoleglycerol phosphate synthase glutamine amidotransferase subunit HisH
MRVCFLNTFFNERALSLWLREFDEELEILDCSQIADCDLVVAPGVCNSVQTKLDELRYALSDESNCVVLAICGGFQSLFAGSDESGAKGISALNEPVVSMQSELDEPLTVTGYKLCSDGNRYYFNNSYGVLRSDNLLKNPSFKFHYFGEILAMVTNDKLVGCQFHPELSGVNGRIIYNKIVERM